MGYLDLKYLNYRVNVSVMKNEELGLLLLKNVIVNEQNEIVDIAMETTRLPYTHSTTNDETSNILNKVNVEDIQWKLKEVLVDYTISISESSCKSLTEEIEDIKLNYFVSLDDYLAIQEMSAEELLEEYENYLGSRALLGSEPFEKQSIEVDNGQEVPLKTMLTKVSPKTGSPLERGWRYSWNEYLSKCFFKHKDFKRLGEHLETLIRVAQWKDDYLVFLPECIRIVNVDCDYVSSSSSIKEAIVEEYLPLLEDFYEGNDADHLLEGINHIKENIIGS